MVLRPTVPATPRAHALFGQVTQAPAAREQEQLHGGPGAAPPSSPVAAAKRPAGQELQGSALPGPDVPEADGGGGTSSGLNSNQLRCCTALWLAPGPGCSSAACSLGCVGAVCGDRDELTWQRCYGAQPDDVCVRLSAYRHTAVL